MTITLSPRFYNELEQITDFIAIDSPHNAIKFYDALLVTINQVSESPFQYRKRASTNDESIRELIFKGYVVIFKINNSEEIILLGIFNQNIWNKQ